MSEVLKNFGNSDPDWVAVVLFVRNLLGQLTVYTDEKKAEIQQEVFAELAKKDFSHTHFETVIAMLDMYVMQTIGTLELEEALTREKRSAAQLLNEMDEVINTMTGANERQNRKLDAFKERTVGVIESGKDKSVIVAKVRDMFQELIIEFKEEAAELHARAKMLERTANFDPLLTELHNRRAFDAYLPEVVSIMDKEPSPLTVMMIDVDHFKTVNDTYGHQAGDDVLRALARIITAHAIQYRGFAARYGGEELVIVAKGLPPDVATLRAEAIRRDVEQYDFRIRTDGKLAEKPLKFTISIGIAHWQEGWDAGRLVRAADMALYDAKNRGRNMVCQADCEQ
ncbi:GGDEF domain-containing protein [Pseudodesulfovibrio sp. zrk46]|uniref:GGDEF domain-containing protein n=1 Tax=Pseudodesulfovibrio sp. zrk46 TaxID=2725288 RepID=UPI001FFD59DB|nr:GGDEF domain-containing protein [Pseudodesulfovibrio sp. zrk46]